MADIATLLLEVANEPAEIISAAQSRAARALIQMSQAELARRAGIAESTVVYFERGQSDPLPATRRRLLKALTRAGCQFIVDGQRGVGVYLRRRRRPKVRPRPADRTSQIEPL